MKIDQRKIFYVLAGILVLGFFGYRSYIKRNPIDRSLEQNKDLTDHFEEVISSNPIQAESKYLGNSLEDGDSPFDQLYGEGLYSSTDHSLEIINKGGNDVVVFLVSIEDSTVIRNEYVNAGSRFKMTKIPNSRCFLKYYYGKNWNPERLAKGINTGGFDNNEEFIVSNGENDILIFEEKRKNEFVYYNIFEVELETITQEGTTMQETPITASEFFK
ncbi:MAG: hypothetical protein LPK79_07495 [Bacteroidota bacterium]|nr:hypothetical protein [Bacteroidota bacterium]MDX5449149.1 hypothetical protein [Bacteroidota bacterium]